MASAAPTSEDTMEEDSVAQAEDVDDTNDNEVGSSPSAPEEEDEDEDEDPDMDADIDADHDHDQDADADADQDLDDEADGREDGKTSATAAKASSPAPTDDEPKKPRSRKRKSQGEGGAPPAKRSRKRKDANGDEPKKRMGRPKSEDRHREKGDRICEWEGCHQTLPTLEDLVDHLVESHVSNLKQPLMCAWEGCSRVGEQQSSKSALVQHLRTHTGEKPYKCKLDGCNARFSRQDNMNKHVKNHELGKIDVVDEVALEKKKSPRAKPGSGTRRRKGAAAATPVQPENGHSPQQNGDHPASPTAAVSRTSPPNDHLPLVQSPLVTGTGAPSTPAGKFSIGSITGLSSSLSNNHASDETRPTPGSKASGHTSEKTSKHHAAAAAAAAVVASPAIPADTPYLAEYRAQLDKFRHILSENEQLEESLKSAKLKIKRLKAEKDVILDDLLRHLQARKVSP